MDEKIAITKDDLLWYRSKQTIELHDGYIQIGGDRVGEGFVRAMIELADRLFPTGWRVRDGFVVPSNTDTPSRTGAWLAELEHERAVKGLNPDGTRKKKAKKKPAPKRKPVQRKIKRREKKSQAISLKRRRK